jgi:hypothetical protein
VSCNKKSVVFSLPIMTGQSGFLHSEKHINSDSSVPLFVHEQQW